MNDASLETKVLGDVVAILADVLLGCACVDGEEGRQIDGLGEDVRGVAGLRNLNDNSPFEVEDVLRAEEVDQACAFGQLAIEKRIVVELPVDLADIEVVRDALIATEAAEILVLDWLALNKRPDLFDRAGVMAKSLIRSARGLHGFISAGR